MDSNKLGNIQGVFFDLGGTLFHHLDPTTTAGNFLQTLPDNTLTDADKAAVVERYRQHRKQTEAAALYKSFYMHRGLVAKAYARTVATLPEVSSAQQVAQQTSRFCDLQATSVTEQLTLRPDTLSTLDELRARRIFVAIVSNIDDNYIEPLIHKWALTQHVDYWISSEQARSCKPHSGIFQKALEAANLPANQVLFVGDSFEHDVVGARRLGMKTALLTIDHTDPPTAGAHLYCLGLSELLSKI